MTKQEALANIGQPFKVTDLHGGIAGSFDKILTVDETGEISGEFLQAHHDLCRLKGDQPEHLKKFNNQSN